jgi:hypothetical protein
MAKYKKMTDFERELLSKCIALEYSNRMLRVQLSAAPSITRRDNFEIGGIIEECIHGKN